MTNKAYSIQYFLAVLLALVVGNGYANPTSDPRAEYTKTINREFQTNADGLVSLYNKYGKVNVRTHTGTNVKLDITIVVKAGSQSEANRTFDRINVNFISSYGYVKAETIIEPETTNRWFTSNSMFGGGNCEDMKINYEVLMPIGNQLDLKNKYGNSYVGNLNGKLTAEVKYGDLQVETIANNADVYLGYGNGSITKVNNLNGEVSYGKLRIGDAKDIALDTKYSEMNFSKALEVSLISKYDDYTFGSVKKLQMQTKYSDIKLDKCGTGYLTASYTDLKFNTLLERLDVDLSYGNLNITTLESGFSGVDIKASYSDVKINLARGASCKFDLSGKYTSIKYPEGASIHKSNEGSNTKQVVGQTGSNGGMIFARLNYGGVSVR